MKRILCLLMVIAMFSLTGCRSERLGGTPSPPDPESSINLDSLEELAEIFATTVYYARNEKNAPDHTLLSTVIPTQISE